MVIVRWLNRIHDAIGQCGVGAELSGGAAIALWPGQTKLVRTQRPPKLVGCCCRLAREGCAKAQSLYVEKRVGTNTPDNCSCGGPSVARALAVAPRHAVYGRIVPVDLRCGPNLGE